MFHIKMPTNKKALCKSFVSMWFAWGLFVWISCQYRFYTKCQCKNIVLMTIFLSWTDAESWNGTTEKSKTVYYLFVACSTLHLTSDELNFRFPYFSCFSFRSLALSPAFDILLVCNVHREYLPSIWCFLHPSYGCHFPFPIELTAARHKRLNIALFIFSTSNIFPIDLLVHTRIKSLKST